MTANGRQQRGLGSHGTRVVVEEASRPSAHHRQYISSFRTQVSPIPRFRGHLLYQRCRENSALFYRMGYRRYHSMWHCVLLFRLLCGRAVKDLKPPGNNFTAERATHRWCAGQLNDAKSDSSGVGGGDETKENQRAVQCVFAVLVVRARHLNEIDPYSCSAPYLQNKSAGEPCV